MLPHLMFALRCAAWNRGKIITASVGMAFGIFFVAVAFAETRNIRVIGGLANVNQFTKHEQPFWNERLHVITNGQLRGKIIPLEQSGMRGDELIDLVKLGVVPFATLPTGDASNTEQLLAGADLAGLSPDLNTVKAIVKAYRPVLQKVLQESHNAKLLAVYIYPAQMLFCRHSIGGLSGLGGVRVRVSSNTQADFVGALGGIPVRAPFNEILKQVEAGNIDCAITGSMSGNTIGLAGKTNYLYTMAISWGMSLFVANLNAWNALPADSRAVLDIALPKLEQDIWSEAELETKDGVACNTNQRSCSGGRRFNMTAIELGSKEDLLRRKRFAEIVLPAWFLRCGTPCQQAWHSYISPLSMDGVR